MALLCVTAAAMTLLACLASAHICFISPVQRGPVSIAWPGESACYRRTPYCSGIAVGPPLTKYVAGSQAQIAFQQNLNHFYPPKPGFLDIALSYNVLNPSEQDFELLGRVADSAAYDMVWQTNFSVSVTFPPQPCDHCILRLRYVLYNPLEVDPTNNTDAIFYNCADIALVAREAEAAAQYVRPSNTMLPAAIDGDGARGSDEYPATSAVNCCTPRAWVMQATEYNANGVVAHTRCGTMQTHKPCDGTAMAPLTRAGSPRAFASSPTTAW